MLKLSDFCSKPIIRSRLCQTDLTLQKPALIKAGYSAWWFLLFIILTNSCASHINRPDFTWPVKPPYTLSRHFSIYHEGIDFPKGTGEAVLATAKGTVIYTGAQFSGYGKMIIIEHDYNWASLYAHLSKISVRKGAKVEKKQKVGEVGNTGRSSSPHLHFELMHKKQPVNPTPYLE